MPRVLDVTVVGWALIFAGCGHRKADEYIEADAVPTPSSVRAARRAFDGAPPVIPHEPLAADCAECHSAAGRSVPGVGLAPPNPHLETPGIGDAANCKQCHVFAATDATFVASTFQRLTQDLRQSDRGHAYAPPVIPHQVFMREACAACHTGPAARPEVLCDHPERLNCRQCHLPGGKAARRQDSKTET